MVDVHQVATDIGVEVMGHKEKIKDIKVNTDNAQENMEKGNEEMEIANERAAVTDKYMKYIFACVAVFVLILLFILFRKWLTVNN